MADKLKDRLLTGAARQIGAPNYQHQADAAHYIMEAVKAQAGVAVATAQLPRSLGAGDYRKWIDEARQLDAATVRSLRDHYRAAYPNMQQLPRHPPAPAPTVEDFKTADLVVEMLKRGYAVIKMPEDGDLPEVLK